MPPHGIAGALLLTTAPSVVTDVFSVRIDGISLLACRSVTIQARALARLG